MDKESIYTSTGGKLMRHPGAIKRFKGAGIATPVSLQIAPTSRCNLKCVFCSNVNREKHEDLSCDLITNLIFGLIPKGLKTVEWTGGGDPTLYPDIDKAINWLDVCGLRQGVITNGIAIKESIRQENLNKLSWLRISMNCLDYVDSIEIPEITGVLGFSYVMNEKTDENVLDRLKRYTRVYEPSYVRVVPNCQASPEEQEENNRRFSKEISEWGSPFFYQAKNFSSPERCWWGFFKPFVLHDGWAYRCSSVVLNDDAERQFHKKYRWVRAEDLPELYDRSAEPASTECSHCVFRPQNDDIDMITADIGDMGDFL